MRAAATARRRGSPAPAALRAVALALASLGAVRAQESAPAAAAQDTTSCVLCHADPARVPDPADRDPVEHYAQDVHHAAGLSCHDCHGGAPDVELSAPDAKQRAHAVEAGFTGRPALAAIPAFCGRCHSDAAYMSRFDPDARVDQQARYATSVHGERLAAGDTKVANCISCHGRHPGGEKASALAHGITRVSDLHSPVHPTAVAATCGRCHSDADYMAGYGIPTDQQALYEQSAHHAQLVDAEDLSAPTCNDCHGNHGARPPGVADLAFVCGSCHGRQAELFRASTMSFMFEFNELGECMVCHGNHGIVPPSDDMLVSRGVGIEQSLQRCDDCHTAPDDAGVPAGQAMHDGIVGLAQALGSAETTLADARAKGMPVSEATYLLTGAVDALIEARVAIHRFDPALVAEALAPGAKLAEEAQQAGLAAIEDYYFRHRWLAISLVGIAFVIWTLVLKVRQVDRRRRQALGKEPAASA